jgi:hypothetical protein
MPLYTKLPGDLQEVDVIVSISACVPQPYLLNVESGHFPHDRFQELTKPRLLEVMSMSKILSTHNISPLTQPSQVVSPDAW